MEDDIIESYKVSDFMRKDFPVIIEQAPFYTVIEAFKNSDTYSEFY